MAARTQLFGAGHPIVKLFSKLLGSKPSWRYAAGGTVWKLLCAGDTLLGDARDLNAHTASFFALQLGSGEVLWNNVTLPQQWWIGMQVIVGDTLLLHGFEKPDMPIPKGMYALDLATGTMRWADEQLTFLFTSNDRVYAQRSAFASRSFLEIDPLTGNVAYDYGENEEGIMQLRALATAADEPGYVFAETLQTFPAATQEMITRGVDLSRARGVVDVAEAGGFTIVAFHEPAKGATAMLNNRVMNRLKVLSRAGAVVFEDVLIEDAPAPVPDVFFVKDDVLLYVKDTTHVTGVRLADLQT